MDLERTKQLLKFYSEEEQVSHEELQALRDKILCVKEFQKLSKQLEGDNYVFDKCLKYLKYEFYPKNRLVMYAGQKKDHFYFILQGSCGQFQQKEDSYINKEIQYFGILQELQTNLRYLQSKLSQVVSLQEEQNTIYDIKILHQKISVAEATLQVYRKEIDQGKLKEAILSLEESQLRHKLYQKHFQLNNLCLYTKERVLNSGDSIDQITLNAKDNKNTVITLEESHILSIKIEDYSRVFQHIVKQIQQSQKIMRNYFPNINEEIILFLSYEFTTHYFERNEIIYSQNTCNPQSFFILLQGAIEIRKYVEKGGKQQNCKSNSQFVGNSCNIIKLETQNTNTPLQNKLIKIDEDNNDDSFQQLIVSEKQLDQKQKTKSIKTQNTKTGPSKQKEETQKTFNINDPFHSIIVYSGQQVFGTECNGKLNEYSAVSISTETKVIILDKKKFDLYDHQFNFRGFLKKQGLIQNQFYQERLSRLEDFSKKMQDEQIKNKQLLQTQVKESQSSSQTSGMTNNSSAKHNYQDLDQGELVQSDKKNNIFDFQQKLHQQSLLKSVFSSQSSEISFKDLIQKLIQTRNNKQETQFNKDDEFNQKNDPLISQTSPEKVNQQIQQQQQEINRGFDFEMNDDKKRRINILIDHKVYKQLNIKKAIKAKTGDQLGSHRTQKLDQKISSSTKNTNNINNNNNSQQGVEDPSQLLQKQKQGKQYVQREGLFPWLDQFGYRKEIQQSTNHLSLHQIQKKIEFQNSIIKELKQRNSQDLDLSPVGSNRMRKTSLENIHENKYQINFQDETPIIPDKTQPKKSSINLNLTSRQINLIKSSINIMREQDQQEQEQIQDMQKIFSTNRIILNRSSSNNHSNQKSSQDQNNLSQSSIANFNNNEAVGYSNRSQSQNFSSCSLNSQVSKAAQDLIGTPTNYVKQQRNKEKIRKTKKYKSTIITNSSPQIVQQQQQQQQPPLVKATTQDNFYHNDQKEIPSLSIFSPLPKKQRALQSHHIDQLKTELPIIDNSSTPSIKSQVNLLKKRNLIAENFSPFINTKLNLSQKLDKSPSYVSVSQHGLFTDRFCNGDNIQKDSIISHVKKMSENLGVLSSLSCTSSFKKNINRQFSQEPLTPSTLAPSPLTFNSGQQTSFSCFKQKSSNFIR